MADVGYTPPGMYLNVCNNDAAVRAAMGSNLWYSGTFSMYSPAASYASVISGISNTEFVSMWSSQYGLEPTYHAAAQFAAGEILYEAITQRATQVNCVSSPSQCTNGQALASIVEAGSWSTIMSNQALTFDANHQAAGAWVTLQYDVVDALAVIATSSELVYPMPSFSSRSVSAAIDDDGNDDDGNDDDNTVTVVVNSGGSNDDDDATPMKVATAVSLTAIFCFLGGMFSTLLMVVLLKPVFLVGAGQSAGGQAAVQMNPLGKV